MVLIGFLIHPFVWLWTLFLLGVFIALPDRFSQRITTKDNLGNWLVITAGLIVLMSLGAVNFSGISDAAGFSLLRYIAHPHTIAWSLLVIAAIILYDDDKANALLARDNFGKFLLVFGGALLVFGIGLMRLDRLINGQLILGFLLGVSLSLFWFNQSDLRERIRNFRQDDLAEGASDETE